MDINKIVDKLNPLDYNIEKVNLTLLFDNKIILLLSDFDSEIMYTLFINRTLIAVGLSNEDSFIINFNKYLSDLRINLKK